MENINKLVLIVLTVICVFSGISSANVTYSFNLITNNSTDNSGVLVANQLFVDIADEGFSMDDNAWQASFTFRNEGPLNSTIAEIYFDDGLVLDSLSSIYSSDTVFYTGDNDERVTPGNLPGGDTLDPRFTATVYLSSDADSGNINGVDPYESVKLTFNLVDQMNYSGVIDSLEATPDDDIFMRIGLHVRGIDPDSEFSEGYVNNGQVIVPVPGAMLLGGIGVSFVGWLRRKRAL